jgi:hypothetical protein
MAKDYLSGLFDFKEFYRFGFVWSTSPESPFLTLGILF